jgi:hypothetical protein
MRIPSLAESIPCNRFLDSLNVYKYGLCNEMGLDKPTCTIYIYYVYLRTAQARALYTLQLTFSCFHYSVANS